MGIHLEYAPDMAELDDLVATARDGMGRPQESPLPRPPMASSSNVVAGNRSGLRQARWPQHQSALLHAALAQSKAGGPSSASPFDGARAATPPFTRLRSSSLFHARNRGQPALSLTGSRLGSPPPRRPWPDPGREGPSAPPRPDLVRVLKLEWTLEIKCLFNYTVNYSFQLYLLKKIYI